MTTDHRRAGAGVVDQVIQASEPVDGIGDRRLHISLDRDVGADETEAGATIACPSAAQAAIPKLSSFCPRPGRLPSCRAFLPPGLEHFASRLIGGRRPRSLSP